MKSSSFETTSSAGGSSGTGTGSRSGSGSFNLRNLSKVILPPLGGPSGQSQSHGGSDKWDISPLDSRYRWWDTLMVVMVVYSAWVYPFEVAFMNASPKGGLEVADMVVDLFFAVDIVLTFFVAYIDHRTQLLVRDRRKITLRLQPQGTADWSSVCQALLTDSWKLHYTFILFLSSTLLHTGV